jgi:hypothetical protein
VTTAQHLETLDERTAREQAEWQAEQLARNLAHERRMNALRRDKLDGQIAHYTTWRDHLQGWKTQSEARLAEVVALLATRLDRFERYRLEQERDALRDTLSDILGGWHRNSCGQLLALAQAAGITPLPGHQGIFEMRPGLNMTLRLLDELTKERDRLG